ncbi:MAG: hypothetical protein IPF55_02905 [Rhodoferax sp.]|nr:hypothetical protein [Rhodoferax sp.]
MTHPSAPRLWSARYKASQIEVCEVNGFHHWIASKEIRKVLPGLRSDVQLQGQYPSGFKKLDSRARYHFNEAALVSELQRIGSQDGLLLLAWLERTVFYPARRKREVFPAPAMMPPPVQAAEPERAVQAGDQHQHHHLHLMARTPARPAPPVATRRVVAPPPATDPIHIRCVRAARRFLGGKDGLARTVLTGGAALVCWTFVVLFALQGLTHDTDYTGKYLLRQWLVLLLIASLALMCAGWCIAVMRCALRRQREGHNLVVSFLAFVGSLMLLPNLMSFPLLLADEWLQGWWESVRYEVTVADVMRIPDLGRIVVRGELGFGSYKALEQAILAKPRLTLVQIESAGGYVVEGLAMARLIEAHRMDTVSLEECDSACTLLLAAGQERYLGPNAVVGFHRSGRPGREPSASWTPTDHRIADYYRSRATTEEFVRLALNTPFNRIWTPEPGQMFAAGYATKWWRERKAGY